ncbi:hypothetical protein NMY22_g18289 [Coprinellus aureogranulatus]|nr:hypothetical protein NMY22_g18289 [Coprinellus aureogranulatus]
MSTASQPQPPIASPRRNDELTQLPPRYSTLSLSTLPVYPTAGELDISHLVEDRGGVSRQAFDFCLENKGASAHGDERAWATMRIFSFVPESVQRPRFTSGQIIEGAVLLNLKRPQAVLSISVVLKGQMVTSSRSDGAHCFLEVVTPIWDNTMDASSASSTATSASAKGKLQGRYAWPFSIPFPTEFPDSFVSTDKRKGQSQQEGRTMYPCPQTICQRGINASIQYEMTLKMTTSGIFKPKHRVSATVLYVPIIRSPPLPPLRASAYACGSFLVGPEDDPTGWQPLPKFSVRVGFRGDATASACDIECEAYIANPTTYTRGSVIPCYLVCKTPDTSGYSKALLQAVVSQNCISMTLMQSVEHHQDPRVVAGPATFSGTVKLPASERTQHLEEGGSAVWWTPRKQHAGEGAALIEDGNLISELSLEGEIHTDIELVRGVAWDTAVQGHTAKEKRGRRRHDDRLAAASSESNMYIR